MSHRSAGLLCGGCSHGVCGGGGRHSREGAQAALPPGHVVGVGDDDQLRVGDDGRPLLLPHRLQEGGRTQHLVLTLSPLHEGAERTSLSGFMGPWAHAAQAGLLRHSVWSSREGSHVRSGCVHSTNSIIYVQPSPFPVLRSQAARSSERRESDKPVSLGE